MDGIEMGEILWDRGGGIARPDAFWHETIFGDDGNKAFFTEAVNEGVRAGDA